MPLAGRGGDDHAPAAANLATQSYRTHHGTRSYSILDIAEAPIATSGDRDTCLTADVPSGERYRAPRSRFSRPPAHTVIGDKTDLAFIQVIPPPQRHTLALA